MVVVDTWPIFSSSLIQPTFLVVFGNAFPVSVTFGQNVIDLVVLAVDLGEMFGGDSAFKTLYGLLEFMVFVMPESGFDIGHDIDNVFMLALDAALAFYIQPSVVLPPTQNANRQ